MRVIVIGGGVAGLVAARACAIGGADVVILESGSDCGGSVARADVAGLALDAAAESFATRGGTVERLLAELDLTSRIEWPNAAGAWLRLADRTVPMPKGGLLGIPIDPLADDVVAAIGPDAARRAQRDLDEPAVGVTVDDSRTLGALVRERMGDAVLDRLVAPVVTGIYATDPDELDLDAIAPGLREAFAGTGSLARAVRRLRQSGGPGSPTPKTATTDRASVPAAAAVRPGSAAGGLRGGMWTLVDALLADLRARGVLLEASTAATALTVRADGSWDVAVAARPAPRQGILGETQDDTTGLTENPLSQRSDAREGTLRADAVIVATDGPTAMRLLASGGDAASLAVLRGIAWPEPVRVDLATLVLDASALDAAPRGTGLLVADDADSADDAVAAKALTHSTAKWSWLAETAGDGRHVVRLSYGRPGAPNPAAALDDAQLRERALRDASALLGVPLSADQVAGFARRTWLYPRSLAAAGQAARVRAVRQAVTATPGLEVTGAWVAGTGLASVIPDAQDAATRALR